MSGTREITLRGRRGPLAALRHGNPDGPKVLAVHGWLDNAASFEPLFPHLEAFDLVALDLPGHGGSVHAAPGDDYVYVDWLHDLLDALDALGWERAHLIGHSLGATLCSTLAAAAPERVDRLALIEGLGALSAPADSAATRLRAALTARRHWLARPERERRPMPNLAAAVAARLAATPMRPEDAERIVARNLQPVAGGLAWRSDARLKLPSALRLTEEAVHVILAAISAETLLIVADPAPNYFPVTMQSARLACLQQAERRQLPGGHHLHMEQPITVGAWITAHLNGQNMT